MARLNPKGMITGTAGAVYYRTYKGTTVVQSRPGKGKVKQTVGTKNHTADFGFASKLSKALRDSLFPILQGNEDSAFYRRFTAVVYAAAQEGNPNPKGSRRLIDGNLSLLSHINCNINSPFNSYCNVNIMPLWNEHQQLELSLPEFVVSEQITRIPEATHAELALLVTVIHPETYAMVHAELFKLDFALQNETIPARQFTTTVLPQGHLVLVSAALFYYRSNALAGLVPLCGKDFHPCEVVGCFVNSH